MIYISENIIIIFSLCLVSLNLFIYLLLIHSFETNEEDHIFNILLHVIIHMEESIRSFFPSWFIFRVEILFPSPVSSPSLKVFSSSSFCFFSGSLLFSFFLFPFSFFYSFFSSITKELLSRGFLIRGNFWFFLFFFLYRLLPCTFSHLLSNSIRMALFFVFL